MGKKSKRRGAGARNGKHQQAPSAENETSSLLVAHPATSTTDNSSRRLQILARRDPRVRADMLVEKFGQMSSSMNKSDGHCDFWIEQRARIFMSYYAFFKKEICHEHKSDSVLTDKNWKFLKKIRRSDKEQMFLRFGAFELSGWYCLLGGSVAGSKRDDAVIYFDKASTLLDSLDEKEKLWTLDLFGDGELVRVGDDMARRREAWIECINHLNSKYVFGSWVPDGTGGLTDRNELCLAGSECNCCGKTRNTLGVFTLRVCEACELAYYCSTECQTKAWKGIRSCVVGKVNSSQEI